MVGPDLYHTQDVKAQEACSKESSVGKCDASVQVSLPVAKVNGCPVGLGLIGPRGSDEELLRLAEQLLPMLKEA